MHISSESKSLFYDILNESEPNVNKKINIVDMPSVNQIDKSSKDDILENCLISNQPLTDNYITLICAHKFNYESLLDSIIIQKTVRNTLNTTSLSSCQIQCPYCRNIQHRILPFIPTQKHKKRVSRVTGPQTLCMKHMKCTWCFKSGKRKGAICNDTGYKNNEGVFCISHHKTMDKKEKFLDWNQEMEDMKKLTIPQIKAILHESKLKKTGNKTSLIQRAVTFQKLYTT